MGGIEQEILGGTAEGGAFLNAPDQDSQEETESFVVMSVDGERFAIEIGKVREIVRVPIITWIPGSAEFIRGVINLRGNVIAVVDLAVLLSLAALEIGPSSRVVIVESTGVNVGMLVAEVSEVTDIPPARLEPSMRTLDEKQQKVVVSQTNINDRLVGILDMDEIIKQALESQ